MKHFLHSCAFVALIASSVVFSTTNLFAEVACPEEHVGRQCGTSNLCPDGKKYCQSDGSCACNAPALDRCVEYYTSVNCRDITPTKTYGSANGCTNYAVECYEGYYSQSYITNNVYLKITTCSACNTAAGYSGPSNDSTDSYCFEMNTSEPISRMYGTCTCDGTPTWQDATWRDMMVGAKLEDCHTGSTTYGCRAGYYGNTVTLSDSATPSAGDVTCTACPNGASPCAAGSTTFTCGIGYYKSGDMCLVCPVGAEPCAAGSTTFTCTAGYYKSGNTCLACPAGAESCAAGSTTFTCSAGYYMNDAGDDCIACPSDRNSRQGASAIGSRGIGSCFIPESSNWSYTNDTGTWHYNNDCYIDRCNGGYTCSTWTSTGVCATNGYGNCTNGCCADYCSTKICTSYLDCRNYTGGCDTTTHCCAGRSCGDGGRACSNNDDCGSLYTCKVAAGEIKGCCVKASIIIDDPVVIDDPGSGEVVDPGDPTDPTDPVNPGTGEPIVVNPVSKYGDCDAAGMACVSTGGGAESCTSGATCYEETGGSAHCYCAGYEP